MGYVMQNFVRFLKSEEEGATAIEYGLIAALISIAAVAGMSAVGIQIGTVLDSITSSLG